MLSKDEIEENLNQLLNSFNLPQTSQVDAQRFAKLAIIELCGWIEEAMDLIIQEHSGRKLTSAQNIKLINEMVKRNHGFAYEGNFRKMLITLIGTIPLETFEAGLDQSAFLKLNAALEYLVAIRNPQAHTFLKFTTPRIDSPSVALDKLKDVYAGLLAFDSELARL